MLGQQKMMTGADGIARVFQMPWARRFVAGPPEAVAISDLLHRGSAGAPRPTDALAAGPGGGGDRPVVGRPAISTASDLTRTKVRPYRRICRALFGWLFETCCQMVYRSALHPPSPRKPSRKVPAVPRACIKQEFGARKPLAATLPTDWGRAAAELLALGAQETAAKEWAETKQTGTEQQQRRRLGGRDDGGAYLSLANCYFG
jgi:hypothetical protein